MNIGNSIKLIRKKRQVSQGELAASCDITQAYLSQIENNRKEPNLSTLKVISENLNVPLPLILFNSIEEEDIPENKYASFNSISDSLNDLITDIYF